MTNVNKQRAANITAEKFINAFGETRYRFIDGVQMIGPIKVSRIAVCETGKPSAQQSKRADGSGVDENGEGEQRARTYYTIRNDESGASLGMGGHLDRGRARDLLLAPRPVPLVKSEWFVTEWYGDGSDHDEIVNQTTADEWLAT